MCLLEETSVTCPRLYSRADGCFHQNITLGNIFAVLRMCTFHRIFKYYYHKGHFCQTSDVPEITQYFMRYNKMKWKTWRSSLVRLFTSIIILPALTPSIVMSKKTRGFPMSSPNYDFFLNKSARQQSWCPRSVSVSIYESSNADAKE